MSEKEILAILKEIKDLLVPISVCFEEQYNEIRRKKLSTQLDTFRKMLTPTREAIFPLLFDARNLSQTEIARIAKTSQPTVSRFVTNLIDQGLIDSLEDVDGHIRYVDKYDLLKELESKE